MFTKARITERVPLGGLEVETKIAVLVRLGGMLRGSPIVPWLLHEPDTKRLTPFKATLANVGQELDYLDGPDFQKFWDIDGKRSDEAVISIGRQG